MRTFAALLVAAGWAAALSGCSFSTSCNDAGCFNRVAFELGHDLLVGETYTMEACVDDYCETATLGGPDAQGTAASQASGTARLSLDTDRDIVNLETMSSRDWSGTHRTSLTVRDSAGDTVAAVARETRFERTQPNGPDCPPVCWNARVSADH